MIGVSPFYRLPQIGVEGNRSPAGLAGLQTGDVVLSVDGKSVESWSELEQALAVAPTGAARLVVFVRPPATTTSWVEAISYGQGRVTLELRAPSRSRWSVPAPGTRFPTR